MSLHNSYALQFASSFNVCVCVGVANFNFTILRSHTLSHFLAQTHYLHVCVCDFACLTNSFSLIYSSVFLLSVVTINLLLFCWCFFVFFFEGFSCWGLTNCKFFSSGFLPPFSYVFVYIDFYRFFFVFNKRDISLNTKYLFYLIYSEFCWLVVLLN